jgi:hypothetical protein
MFLTGAESPERSVRPGVPAASCCFLLGMIGACEKGANLPATLGCLGRQRRRSSGSVLGHPDGLLDIGDPQAIDTGSVRATVARHPVERHIQRRRVAHEVVRSDRSAVPALPLARFCGPPPEPDVPVGRASGSPQARQVPRRQVMLAHGVGIAVPR